MRPSGRSSVWLLMAAAGAGGGVLCRPDSARPGGHWIWGGRPQPRGVPLGRDLRGGRVEYRKSRVVAPARLRPFHRPDDPKFQ